MLVTSWYQGFDPAEANLMTGVSGRFLSGSHFDDRKIHMQIHALS